MSKIFLLITSGDPRILTDVVFPYVRNAKKHGWMDTIRVIFWGPSEKVLVSALEVKAQIIDLVDLLPENVFACQECAEDYHIKDLIEALGVNVEFIGQLISDMLKEEWLQLTF